MEEVLVSGKTSFKIEVPYKLIEVGEKGMKPLVVYLHGFNQNIETFSDQIAGLLDIPAYHLLIQGPYPLYDRDRKARVEEWGRAWYLYDGEQEQFVKSLEQSSDFIQQLIDRISRHIEVGRLALIGYSMGGYLGGYFALSRWKHVNELIVIGGRIKTEVFEDRKGSYGHMNVLALHGRHDTSVDGNRQRESCRQLAGWGARVTFTEIETNHKLSEKFVAEAVNWLQSVGYETG